MFQSTDDVYADYQNTNSLVAQADPKMFSIYSLYESGSKKMGIKYDGIAVKKDGVVNIPPLKLKGSESIKGVAKLSGIGSRYGFDFVDWS